MPLTVFSWFATLHVGVLENALHRYIVQWPRKFLGAKYTARRTLHERISKTIHFILLPGKGFLLRAWKNEHEVKWLSLLLLFQ